MFSAIVDRTWAPSLFYLVFISIIWSVKYLIPISLTYGILLLATLYHGQKIIYAISIERKLDALGGRAPRVKDYVSVSRLLHSAHPGLHIASEPVKQHEWAS